MSPRHDTIAGYLHSNELASSFHSSFVDLMGYDVTHDGRLKEWVKIKSGTMGIPDGRNKLCAQFLKSGCEWLFQIDSDMGFKMNLLDQLLGVAESQKIPVLGALAFAYREAGPDGMNGMRCYPTPTIMDWVKHRDGISRFTGVTHYPVNTLVQCGATGAACFVIHRAVILSMQEKYGDNWFSRVTGDDGEQMGEDVSFGFRCKEMGIPLFVHTGIRTTHLKNIWVAERDFWRSFLPPPAAEEVDVIVPVLHRPQNVRPLMESLRASTGLAKAWFVCETEDLEEQIEVRKNGGNVLFADGSFALKVNVAVKASHDGSLMLEAPWVLLVGDDVRFRPGWLDWAQDVHRRYGANVVGTNDLANDRVMRGEHATHMLIRRSYIDELGASWDGPGVVCHEGYRHWYVDDEIVTVAKRRQTFESALGSEIEHLHPIVGKAPMDEVYELGQSFAEQDQKLFESRLARFAGGPNREQRRHPERPKLAVAR